METSTAGSPGERSAPAQAQVMAQSPPQSPISSRPCATGQQEAALLREASEALALRSAQRRDGDTEPLRDHALLQTSYACGCKGHGWWQRRRSRRQPLKPPTSVVRVPCVALGDFLSAGVPHSTAAFSVLSQAGILRPHARTTTCIYVVSAIAHHPSPHGCLFFLRCLPTNSPRGPRDMRARSSGCAHGEVDGV